MAAREAVVKFHAEDKTGDAFKSVQRSLQNMASAAGAVGGPLGQVSGRLSTLATSLGRMSIAGASGAVGLTALAFEMKNVYDTAAELESTLFKLGHQIRLSGDHAGVTLGRLERFASGLAKSTLVTKEAILEASSTLLAFQSIGGKTHERLVELGVDLTRSVGGGLVENIKMLGKVIDDPIQNLGSLRDKIGNVDKAWQDSIVAMADAGDKAGATAAILEKLEETIGGGAQAEAGGLRGVVHSLTEEWNDLREAVGKGLGLVADVEAEKHQKFLEDEAALLALVVAERKKLVDYGKLSEMGLGSPSAINDARVALAGYERQLAERRKGNPSEAEASKRQEVQLAKDQANAVLAARWKAAAENAAKVRKQNLKDAEERASDEEKVLQKLAEFRVSTAGEGEKPLEKYLKLDAEILAAGAEAGRLGLERAREFAERRLSLAKAFADAHLDEIEEAGEKELKLRADIAGRLAKDEARTPEQKAELKFAENVGAVQALPDEMERNKAVLQATQIFLDDMEEISVERREKIAEKVKEIHLSSLTDQARAEEDYLADVETLQMARAANAIETEEDLQRRILELTDKFHKSQIDKEKATLKEKISMTASAFGDLAGAFSGYSDIVSARINKSSKEQTQAAENEFDRQLFALEDRHAAALITDEEFSGRKKQLERDKGNTIVAIEQATQDRLNSEGRKAFEISKKLSIAQATLSGVVAAVNSYEAGSKVGGPLVGAAFAAATAAFVATNIAKLNATTFGGGGGGSIGVGGGSLPYTPKDSSPAKAAAPSSTLQVIFNGPVMGFDDFNKRVGEAVRANSDRDVIMITSGSRQATEIRGP